MPAAGDPDVHQQHGELQRLDALCGDDELDAGGRQRDQDRERLVPGQVGEHERGAGQRHDPHGHDGAGERDGDGDAGQHAADAELERVRPTRRAAASPATGRCSRRGQCAVVVLRARRCRATRAGHDAGAHRSGQRDDLRLPGLRDRRGGQHVLRGDGDRQAGAPRL